MLIHKDIDQGTDEWFELRAGKLTASRFKDVLAGGKGLTRKAYMYSILAELLTDEITQSYTNAAMEWGTQTEPQACAMYEFDSGNKVEHVAFIEHSEYIGASPDGLINDNGMLEIKCPNTVTQLQRYIDGAFPVMYKPQVQGQLWVAQREWCDFVSFDPRVKGQSSYMCVRVERDDKYIKTLEEKCNVFIAEMLELKEILKGDEIPGFEGTLEKLDYIKI